MKPDPVKDLPMLFDVEYSPWIRRIAIVLLATFLIAPIVISVAPWQQNVGGAGRVVAFTPLDRPQPVQATITGRVVEVFVGEADPVSEGDPLVRIVDIDPEKVRRLESKLEATRRDLSFAKANVSTFESQTEILEQARDLAVDAFEAKVDVAEQKLLAAQRRRDAKQAELTLVTEQEARIARLVPEFIEEMKLLEVRTKKQTTQAGLDGAIADVDGAKADLRTAQAELGKEREVAAAKVEGARAKMQSESGKAADIQGKIADLEGELRAQNTQLIRAPRDGRVLRLEVNTQSSIVKSGDVLLQIVPTTAQPAVELFVRGVDAPLIEPGRKVRLQFEGWPAVQFVGWPSVAVGTFGGIVSFVDPTDSGNGRFRLVVTPDPDEPDWPKERWLRQGVRTKGWVLLNEVRLWYEMWRQLNGFPPVVALTEPTAPGDDKNSSSKSRRGSK